MPSNDNALTRYFSAFGVLRDCKRDFWITNVIQFFEGMSYFSLLHVLTLFYGKYCGFSDADSTFWVGMFTLLLSMFVLVVGSMCDIIGLKRTYTIGFAILIAGRLLMGNGIDLGGSLFGLTQGNSQYFVIVGLVLMSFGAAFMSPCLGTSIRRFTTLRARATGFNINYLIHNIGTIAASAVIVDTMLATFGDTMGLLWIINVGTFCYCISYCFTRLINEDNYAVPSERVAPEDRDQRRPLLLIAEVIRESAFQKLLLFIFLTLGVRLIFTIQFLVMPQYYMRTVGDDFRLGYLFAINPAIIIVGLIAIIPILNRFSTVSLLIVGMAISAVSIGFMVIPAECYFMLPGIDNYGQAYFVSILIQMVLFSIGELIFSPRFTEYVARVAPKDKVASYMALSGLPMFIAKPINGVVGGLLVSYFCYNGILAKIDTGHTDFWSAPEFMWLIYLLMALVSPLAIYWTRGMFLRMEAQNATVPEEEKPNS